MATANEKGNIVIETSFFCAVFVLLLFFWMENKNEKTSTKEQKFLLGPKLQDLQKTQISSLKEYEVKQ